MCLILSIFSGSLGAAQEAPLIPIMPTKESSNEDLNQYFNKLRQSLEIAGAEEAKGHTKNVTLTRFTKESAAFFVAIAAVQIEALIVDYSENPSALQAHLESLKDPIGHLSFYMFMAANGYTTDFLKKGVKTVDPLAKAQAFRRISYLGMSAGSIASSLTADVLTTMKECAKVIFAKDQKQKADRLVICDGALEQWTLNAKAQQYIPQIISLLVSTEMAQVAEIKGRNLVSWASKNELAKVIASKSGQALRVLGIDILTAANPSGLTVKGIRIVGKVAQFAGFTYIDHQISPFIFKGFANVWQPASFDFDAYGFNNSAYDAKAAGWTNEQANLKLSKNLIDIKKAMTNWRQSQLSQFYASHAIWGANLAKIIDQTQVTFGFYKTYLDNLHSSLNVMHEIEVGVLPKAAVRNQSLYPFRALPLYGVRLLQALPDDYESAEDLYLNNPSDLEAHQFATLRESARILKTEVAGKKLIKADTELVNEIITAFESQDAKAVGRVIEKINDNVLYNRGPVADYSLRNSLVKLRSFIGNPYPILSPGMGFSYAYEMNSFTQSGMKALQRSSGPGKNLSMASDYLTLQMVCGAESRFYESPWGFSPSFSPPKIVSNDLDIPALCRSQFLNNIYGLKLASADGRQYSGITDLISKNIRPEVLGDIRVRSQVSAFDQWWKSNVNQQLESLYKDFDIQYINVLERLTRNWQGFEVGTNCKALRIGKCASGIVNSALDKLNASDYLDQNILKNMELELNIYTTILNEVLNDSLKNGARSLPPAKDAGGLLRRIRAGDFSIFSREKAAELPQITHLKTAIRERLNTLGAISVQNGAVQNFPTKETSKKALKEIAETSKILSDLINQLPAPHKTVAESAAAGVESIVSEISRLNMAFYTAKYRLEDGYEEVLGTLSQNKNEIRNNGPKSFSPKGGQ